MANHMGDAESRVAVLVDCDNTSPEILEYALRVVAQFGRVVVASRTIIWSLVKQMRVCLIPLFHRLHRRTALER